MAYKASTAGFVKYHGHNLSTLLTRRSPARLVTCRNSINVIPRLVPFLSLPLGCYCNLQKFLYLKCCFLQFSIVLCLPISQLWCTFKAQAQDSSDSHSHRLLSRSSFSGLHSHHVDALNFRLHYLVLRHDSIG